MAAKKEQGFSVPGSFDHVYGAAVRAAQRCGWRLDHTAPQSGALRAVHGVNLFTYGEKIDVAVRPRPDGACDVWVKSECRGIQMVDYGRNGKNIALFSSALMTELQASTMPAWQPPPASPAPSARFCSACGSAAEASDRFCRICGARSS